MRVISKALAAHWRSGGFSINGDDWPGVLLSGGGWRVILNRTATAYVIQKREPSRGSLPWVRGYLPGGLPEWLKALPLVVPEGANISALADPVEGAALLAARQGVVVDHRSRRADWTAAEYCRVLAQDQNMRLVVAMTGTVYGLQWYPAAAWSDGRDAPWRSVAVSASLSELVELLAAGAYTPDGVADADEIRGRALVLFDGWPEFAADGPWPVVAVRPAALAVADR